MTSNRGETKSSFLSLYLKGSLQMGNIQTLFENSLNVQFPFGLVHVGQTGMVLSPFGCLISSKDYRQLYAQCRPGDLVRFKQGKLYFYTQQGVFKIELDTFEEVDLSIPKVQLSTAALKDNLLYQVFEETFFSLSIETGLPLTDTIKEGLQALTEPRVKKKLLSDKTVIRLLIGRGIGLTPSGDDILIGYTFARVLFQRTDEWQEKIASALKEKKTTAISAAYFAALLNGYINENFLSLAQLFTENDRENIQNKIQELKRFGHTSGTDTLYGFALGLRYIKRNGEINE